MVFIEIIKQRQRNLVGQVLKVEKFLTEVIEGRITGKDRNKEKAKEVR